MMRTTNPTIKGGDPNSSPMMSSPLKLPRDGGHDAETSPLKKHVVDRAKVVGRPIEIVKGKCCFIIGKFANCHCRSRLLLAVLVSYSAVTRIIDQNND